MRWLAEVGTDIAAFVAARAPKLEAEFKQAEIARNIAAITEDGSLATVSLEWSTANDNLPALRIAYSEATKREAVMIGDYLNSLTDAQLRNIFNLTQAQVTSLRTNKLQPAADLAASLRAATGA